MSLQATYCHLFSLIYLCVIVLTLLCNLIAKTNECKYINICKNAGLKVVFHISNLTCFTCCLHVLKNAGANNNPRTV